MTSPVPSRVAALDWPRIDADLATRGCAAIGALFTPKECAALAAMYEQPQHFRSRVVMQRHGFGQLPAMEAFPALIEAYAREGARPPAPKQD